MKKNIISFLIIWIVLSLFVPVIPFVVKKNWVARQEQISSCGIIDTSDCYKIVVRFWTLPDLVIIIKHHQFNEYFDDSYKRHKNAEDNGFLPY